MYHFLWRRSDPSGQSRHSIYRIRLIHRPFRYYHFHLPAKPARALPAGYLCPCGWRYSSSSYDYPSRLPRRRGSSGYHFRHPPGAYPQPAFSLHHRPRLRHRPHHRPPSGRVPLLPPADSYPANASLTALCNSFFSSISSLSSTSLFRGIKIPPSFIRWFRQQKTKRSYIVINKMRLYPNCVRISICLPPRIARLVLSQPSIVSPP